MAKTCCPSVNHECITCRSCINVRLGCSKCVVCSKCPDCKNNKCEYCKKKES